jgi:hypothetical protein
MIASRSIESSNLLLACDLNLLFSWELLSTEIFLGIAELLYKSSTIHRSIVKISRGEQEQRRTTTFNIIG